MSKELNIDFKDRYDKLKGEHINLLEKYAKLLEANYCIRDNQIESSIYKTKQEQNHIKQWLIDLERYEDVILFEKEDSYKDNFIKEYRSVR